MRSIPSDFGCDESSPTLFSVSVSMRTLSENVVNAGSFFFGETFAAGDSALDEVFIDFTGDFAGFTVDGGLGLLFVGDFLTGDAFRG